MSQLNLVTIRAVGPDAFEFLQGQLSNDLKRLDTEAEILAAWCNPKGRVIWFGTVWKMNDGYGMSVPADTADDIVKRLATFRFRAKLDFNVVDEDATVDPVFLIENGFPYIGAQLVEKFTPHMLNLDLLDAISFDKGCYTGQEIVARTHYRGATRRRTLRFRTEGTVAVGDRISEGDRDVGEVLNVAGHDLLAVVPLDKADAALYANGAALTRESLSYL